MEPVEILKHGTKKMGIEISQYQIEQFIKYKDILLEWNQRMNLTAITEEREIIIMHFLDSISCLQTGYLSMRSTGESIRLIDVGTGAGFPGIPLKIMLPGIKLTLMDSLKKRIGFLKEAGKELGLDGVEFIHGRAEDFGKNKDYREKYNCVVSRAVAALNILVEYCLPFVKVGGYFICQKGPKLIEEMEEAKKAIKILGGKIVEQVKIDIPFSDREHYILITEKIKQTPIKYPRKAGKLSKNPIK
ncbi:MAG: 16S rRNA (guanine(527)-N(7))-methyltransferase RsmG [Alkaliphilus sp.]|nr:16S rRNA (guanine(527)-N(7))-methyltransferase RsmG [Alkaliphilus sp.]